MQWKLVKFSEINKYAITSYWAIHDVDDSYNLGDIVHVNAEDIPEINMICGGSPCQDFSIAGKRMGAIWSCMECGHEYNPITVPYHERSRCPICGSRELDMTRSSLLCEYLRMVHEKRPAFGIYENVKNIVGTKFRKTFDMFVSELENAGYNVYWQVLNAVDYGVPQARKRVYVIFIKTECDNGKFRFPGKIDIDVRLSDVIDKNVDEKYYSGSNREITMLRDFSDSGLCLIACFNGNTSSANRIYTDTYARTLTSGAGGSGANTGWYMLSDGRIRKLTPGECFRLMGFDDTDFIRVKMAGISDNQVYKQAGNSVVVDVLYFIFLELYRAMPYLFDDIKLLSLFSGIGAFERALDRLYSVIGQEAKA